jgi:hypothetical protein
MGKTAVRVAEAEIKANIDEVISMWCGQNLRKEVVLNRRLSNVF